jgi:hypothetical protein
MRCKAPGAPHGHSLQATGNAAARPPAQPECSSYCFSAPQRWWGIRSAHIRTAFGQLENRVPCACFFLAPPMVACKAARGFSRFRLYRLLTGEMGQLLADKPFMLQLPMPPVPTRIYAGVGGPRASWLPFGTEANDGILSMSEATGRYKAMAVEVPSLHTFIMNSGPVCDDMIRLLETLEQTTHPGGTHHQE